MATRRRAATKPRAVQTKRAPARGSAPTPAARAREHRALRRALDEALKKARKLRTDGANGWDETPRSVKRNVLVARTFEPADEAALGSSLLEERALYLQEREGLAKPPPHVDRDRVVVLVPHGRKTLRPAARTARVEQVRAACRALRKTSSRKPRSAVETAIRAAPRKHAGPKGVTVASRTTPSASGRAPRPSSGPWSRRSGR